MCQVDCQTTQWESCQTTIRERCTTSCEDKGGAIFCDGQFLNASNLDDCAAELSAELSVRLDIDLRVDTDGDGDSDNISCAMDPTSSSNAALWLLAGIAGVAVIRRRRA
jgi:MYXO-CTERM domain-containing protein